ncbi:MAG: Glu-tRNA(Gln) amidotransferase subunit GatD, partial [Methanomassiliicoccales archaeon]
FSHPDVIVIKLRSGYNIGIRRGNIEEIRVVEKAGEREVSPGRSGESKADKEVAIIGTGGTIASYVDYRTGGVHPALSADDLVSAVPEIADICRVRAQVLFSIFSENMDVECWQRLAGAVADRLNEGAEGVIIPHGTDTMGYTSAALAFMLEDLPRPVLLVGAQRSSDRPSSDSYTNLLSAARFCVESDVAEVGVLMHEGPSDTTALVHRGTRVRKLHTSRRDAFRSVNARPIARVEFEGGMEILSDHREKSDSKVRVRDSMEGDVALLHFFPGMSADHFREVVLSHSGVVIAGSGLGHVSSPMVTVLEEAVGQGIPVVMTSQCLYGRVNLNVYDTGRDLLKAGIIPAEDMLPETAYVKLMWALGQDPDMEEVRRIMLTDMRGELSRRRELDE